MVEEGSDWNEVVALAQVIFSPFITYNSQPAARVCM